LFIETSAKDGKHIEDACKELARFAEEIFCFSLLFLVVIVS
jgi:hypothetical protein